MRLATILPLQYIDLEFGNDYHMALAHLVPRSEAYAAWFRSRSDKGDTVIMDNGVVEGDQRPAAEIVASAARIGATEVILPDVIGNADKTLELSSAAISHIQPTGRDMMAVPQGSDQSEWERCLAEMLTWPVDTIGFSKFIEPRIGVPRIHLLDKWQEPIASLGKQMHMLGSPDGAYELEEIHENHPLVRGADSGYPTFCAAAGQPVRRDGRRPEPPVEVDWLSTDLGWERRTMEFNYRAWRRWIGIS